MTGTLYLIPNSLGQDRTQSNLHSIIPDQVCRLTAGLSYFIGENAKTTRAHLKHVALSHPLQHVLQDIDIKELNVNTPENALEMLLGPLLEGKDAGLISEAGVPAVADPGANLVKLAHKKGVPVRPLTGPSSLILALMASGLNGQSFAFHGYLPTDSNERAKRIRELDQRSARENQTQMFIETPYRNGALLESLVQHCSTSTSLCLATDITLDSELIVTKSTRDWKKSYSSHAELIHKKPTVFLFLNSTR